MKMKNKLFLLSEVANQGGCTVWDRERLELFFPRKIMTKFLALQNEMAAFAQATEPEHEITVELGLEVSLMIPHVPIQISAEEEAARDAAWAAKWKRLLSTLNENCWFCGVELCAGTAAQCRTCTPFLSCHSCACSCRGRDLETYRLSLSKRTALGQLAAVLEAAGDSPDVPIEHRNSCAEMLSTMALPLITFWGESHADELTKNMRRKMQLEGGDHGTQHA